MTRKSATKVKVIKKQEAQQISSEELFEEQKALEQTTVNQQIVCAKRVDFSVDIRSSWFEYFGDRPFITVVRSYQNKAVELYESIKKIVDNYKYEDFSNELFEDPFEKLIPTIDDMKDDEELWWGNLTYRMVRPYGEHASALHRQISDMVKQEQPLEESVNE